MRNFKLFVENIASSFLKEQILNSEFFREIRRWGGRLYFVGGAVRDFHLKVSSKDVDVIVSNLPHAQLVEILKRHGKVSDVGESFGVLKFVPKEFSVDEPIDIALPRTERPMTQSERDTYKLKYGKYPSAYQAFTVEPDHDLGIESDLLRRDFTINAIAQDHMGNTVDPHGGVDDINNKVIRMVSAKNFSEDPLRMLRGVQFASRFGFEIERLTFETIRRNAEMIKGIPGERILIEIEKIVKKGNQLLGAKLLCETNLWQEISNLSCSNHEANSHLFALSGQSKTTAEFLYLMVSGVSGLSDAISLAKRLKCDVITEKQIKSLYLAWNQDQWGEINGKANPHLAVFNMNRIHPTCLDLLVLPPEVKDSIDSDMPKSVKDLDVNGNDIINLGYKNEKVSQVFFKIIEQVFSGNLKNDKKDIIDYVRSAT